MDQLKYKCPFCHFRTRSIANLNGHINDFHINLKDHSCKYCDFVAKNFENAKHHIQTNHTKLIISTNPNLINQPQINIASEASEDNLEEQSCSSERKRDKIFQCEYCDYSTCYSHSLKSHMNFRHTRATLFKCQYCDYEAPTNSILKRHINSKHTKTVLHKCQYCEYEATELFALNRHINEKHTQIIIFNCQLCEFKTSRAYNLKRHNELKHEQKSFECQSCDYVTEEDERFRQHIIKEHECDPTEATSKKTKMILKTEENNGDYFLFKEEKFIDDEVYVRPNSQHPDAALYETALDNQEMIQSSDPERHIKYEHFQTRFDCRFCDYKPTEEVDLRKHMTSRHPDINDMVLNEIKVEEKFLQSSILVKDEPGIVECHDLKQILDETDIKPEDLHLK